MSQFEAVSRDDHGAAARTVAARSWHLAAPGAELAAALESLTCDRDGIDALGDYDLVELIAAAQRVASWAHAVAATSAAALAERESMEPTISQLVSQSLTPDRIAGEEVAMRLGWTPRAGQRLVSEGQSYRGALMATGEALRLGLLDPSKAAAIRRGLEDVPWQLALGVQDMVLPRAPRRTSAQLTNDVRAALVNLDPAEAAIRSEHAAAQRCVSAPKPLPDGMAGLWLRTTAVAAHALFDGIDAAARAARRAGDPRTLDQLRADVLVHRGLHKADCVADPFANRPRTSQSTRTGPEAAGRAGSARGPLGDCPSAARVDVRVLVPLSTLIGTADEPGHLEGYGAIDPEHSRALARGGTWHRLVTDPLSGVVLDVGRTRYTPPAEMAEHVRYRDLTCIHPGCNASAWKCELDHTIPASEGGLTAARNLAPLSKGCHQIKTHANFTVKRLGPGEYRWRTPTGHNYDVRLRAPVGSIDDRDPIYIHRHHLEEDSLPEPRPDPGGDASASGNSDPPPF